VYTITVGKSVPHIGSQARGMDSSASQVCTLFDMQRIYSVSQRVHIIPPSQWAAAFDWTLWYKAQTLIGRAMTSPALRGSRVLFRTVLLSDIRPLITIIFLTRFPQGCPQVFTSGIVRATFAWGHCVRAQTRPCTLQSCQWRI
jgi:hypothetical protein